MFNSLEDTNLKAFISERCSHLLNAPVGDTGYSVNYFDHDNFMSSTPSPLRMSTSFDANLVKAYENSAGCYSYYCPDTKEYYIGANLDFSLRMRQHFYDSTRVDRLFYNAVNKHGFDNFVWQPTVVTPHYYLDYVRIYKDQGDNYTAYRTLTNMVKYETRLFEQAFKSHINPALNGTGNISFPVNWDSDDVRDSFHSRAFIAVTSEGKEYPFGSLNYGAQILGTSRKTIETVINYDHYVECKHYGSCRFYEPGRPTLTGSPYANPYTKPDHSGIDYKTLPLGKVIAFDANYTEIDSFDNSTAAAKACGFGEDYYRISRYINKNFIEVVMGGVAMKVLFAQNPLSKGRTKQVVRTDLSTGKVVGFNSINDAYFELGNTNDSSDFRKRYVKGDQVYKGKYTFQYLSEYTGPVPIFQTVNKRAK